MISIQSLSNSSAKWLASKVPNDKYPTTEDQIEVFEYGFMVIIGALVKGFLLVSTASILGVLVATMIVTLAFSSLRIIAGGYHMQTYSRCVMISVAMFLGGALIAQHTFQYWSQVNILSLLASSAFIALYIIIRYVPRDTPNKPIVEALEISKFKRWSLIYLITWSTLMTIFILLNLKLIVISSCFGLLLELFSVSKVGYSVYYKIDSLTNSSTN